MKQWIRFFCLSLLLIATGTASAQDVKEISSVDQLKEFRDAVNSGNQYTGKTVKLTADLDLSGESNWTPIGNLVAYPGQSFNGTFDGDGHSISNVTVNDNTPNYAVAGLFGSVVNGTIKNLTVKNVNITSTHYAGGIVAYTSNGPTIENCKVIGGTIKSTPEIVNGSYDNGDKIGGIMGYATGGSTINNCWVEGVTLSAYRDFGGIVGFSAGTVTNNTVKNVTLIQDLTNGYKNPNPTTIGDIIGRDEGATLSNNTVIKSDPVAQIGETKYETLAEAVAAANAGDVIAIIKAGDYTLPNISKNVTIEGKADGVVSFTHTTAGSVASIPNGAKFKNVTFNFGNVNYHGFQHAGTINMEGCTLNGKFFSYADMNFTNCTFEQSNEDYHMWVYGGGTVNYTGCTFNGIGKFLNLYQENGNEEHFVNVDNCTFNSSKNNKAALNVKATCGSTLLQYVVNITKCTTNENFPEASTTDALVVLNGLVQVDDRTADGEDKITVTQDGKKIYPVSYVAQIGENKYETLAEAVAAAQAGDVIEIIKAGDYTLPNLSKNVTIEGKADGVVSFTHTTAGSVASIPSGATFKNVTFNFGNVNYHGFQHAGTINMEGCTLNGKFFSYADMNFTNCTFEQSNEDYHMWVYGGGTVNYTGCTFNGIGKFLNLYQENGNEEHFVNVDNCTFNSSKNNKAALNVKATCGSTLLQYVVNITKCTTNENFPEASTSDALVVLNGLVQVDDRTADGVDKITVTQDGKKIYPVSYVAQIGETQYETLADAVAAATAEATTITLLKDVKEGIVVKDGKNIVLDLNGKTMTGGIDQYDADIVVKNGTVAGTVYVNGAAENTENYNKFTLDATATIIAKDYGIILWQSDKNTAYGSTIDINGTINGCVFVMGNIKEGNSVINVNDGATIKGEVGIALNGYATLNVVDGATIEGTVDSGIEVRAGKLNVTGGKISSTASEYAVNPNGSGTTTTGAAIAVAQHTTGLATEVKISGGEFAGVKSLAIANPQNNTAENVKVAVSGGKFNGDLEVSDTRVSKFVSGGIYSKKPDEKYCAEGYIVTDNTDEATKAQYPFAVKTKEEAGIFELIDGTPYPESLRANGGHAKEVTYTHKFAGAVYSCWWVPFNYTISDEDAAKFDFYTIHMIAGAKAAGEIEETGKIWIYLSKQKSGKLLKAGHIYVIKPTEAINSYTFKATDVDLLSENSTTSRKHTETSDYAYDFYGTYVGYETTKPNDVMWLSKGGTIDWNLSSGAKLGSYRWFIRVTSKTGSDDADAKITIGFKEDEGDTDGINNAQASEGQIQGIYTLGGMKVEHPIKGVNIIKYTDGRTKKINVK